MRGRSLTVAAAICFVTPIVLAFVGAAVSGTQQADQFLGGAGGFGAGMAVAALVARLGQRRDGEKT